MEEFSTVPVHLLSGEELSGQISRDSACTYVALELQNMIGVSLNQ